MSDQPPPVSTEVTPTLGETAKRRAGLRLAIVGVEQAISSPALGRERDWSRKVIEELEGLDRQLVRHIEITERPEGLHAEIVEQAPRLAGKVARLKEEHPELLETTRGLVARFGSAAVGETWPVSEARDDVQRLLGRLVRHRQHGADLVWEAYNLDIGGID